MLLLLFLESETTVRPDSTTHGHTADQAVVVGTVTIDPDSTTHGHTAEEAVIFVATAAIEPDSTTHGHTADQALIGAVISPDSTTHGHTADQAVISLLASIVPNDSRHGHTSEIAIVGITAQIAPNDSRHRHTAAQAVISNSPTQVTLSPAPQIQSLSCGSYDVYIAERGGTRLVCRLQGTVAIRYQRVLNEFSEATITTALNADCRNCLSSVNPWQHEVLIFRSSELVWVGPIQTIDYDPSESRIEIYARDLSSWAEKRHIELFGEDYDVEDVDVRDVFNWVLSHGYDKDPWGMSWSLADTGVPISRYYPAAITGDRWGGSYKNVATELRALSQVGVDFTVVNRHMYGGDLTVTPPTTRVLKIADKNWAKLPKISVVGTTMSNRTGVAGGSGGYFGWADDQIWIEESPADIAQYGLLESFTERTDLDDSDTTALPNAITQEAYARHQLLKHPVATISGGQLANDAPFSFDDLIPGGRISVGFMNSLRDVTPDYRLYGVDVSVSEENETIDLRLSALGVEELRV